MLEEGQVAPIKIKDDVPTTPEECTKRMLVTNEHIQAVSARFSFLIIIDLTFILLMNT